MFWDKWKERFILTTNFEESFTKEVADHLVEQAGVRDLLHFFFSCEFHQASPLIAVDGAGELFIWQLANGSEGQKNIFLIVFA